MKYLCWFCDCLACVFLVAGCQPASDAPASPSTAVAADGDCDRFEWTFIIVANLDNDLGESIGTFRESLHQGVEGGCVAVALLLDDPSTDGLHRVAITTESTEESLLATEDGTDLENLAQFLQWASWVLPAEKYALTFIDHGGHIDEIGRDDHPDMDGAATTAWMVASEAGAVVRQWRDTLVPEEVELLFFEQCGRASIENLYSFAGTAELVLASDRVVYCPGTHYAQVLGQAGAGQLDDGEALARAILERQAGCADFSLVRGELLWELPRRVDEVVEGVQAAGGPTLGTSPSLAPCYCYEGECHYEVLDCLGALVAFQQEGQPRELQNFANWLRDDLVVLHHSDVGVEEGFRSASSGLSLCLPTSAVETALLANLPFYRDCRWWEFVSLMVGDAESGAR